MNEHRQFSVVDQFEQRVFAKQALSNARRTARKIARRRKARSAGSDNSCRTRMALAARARSTARQNAAPAYRHLHWRWVPQPNAKSLACTAFCHLSFARAVSSARLCESPSRPADLHDTLSAAGRQRLVLAGPHPRSRCSWTWHPSAGAALGPRPSLVAAAAGAMGPESDFSGGCDRDCGANALHLPSIGLTPKPRTQLRM